MTSSGKFLRHYGIKRRSGRYPWGSGEEAYQRGNLGFTRQVQELRDKGLNDAEVAAALNTNTSKLRARLAGEKAKQRAEDAAFAFRLKEKGYSDTAIGERMGIGESSVRSLLNPHLKAKNEVLLVVMDELKKEVDSGKMLDVGAGIETRLGITRTKLDNAVSLLEDQGYTVHVVAENQQGTGKKTWIKVLAPPNVETADVRRNRGDIKTIGLQIDDTESGIKVRTMQPMKSVDGKRIYVRYGDEGGKDKDGVIELRRNVEDLDLGGKRYAQVRVQVDGTHFMKGMAMYADDIPDGYDIIYNTNKKRGAPKDEVFKPNKFDEYDPNNPFGSIVKQKYYVDKDGKEQLSPLNVVGYMPGMGEEGSWGEWSKSISSQVLSKQTPGLAKKQLKLVTDMADEEYAEIMGLTNPAVKARLLKSFSDGLDSDAVHLKAAALPRQGNHVILPIPGMKENEVYAPNYRPGEVVVLIRHPHGGTFEIPELRVNNSQKDAKRLLGQAQDAVGINPKVAERLSGADFDGDTVLVIPNNNREIKTTPALEGLKDFDPKARYPKFPGMVPMDKHTKGVEMGKISNLITDMTIKGATTDEIARAVRHSMVVIDAEKHKLNYQASFEAENIAELKKIYQGGEKAGASTLISRASSEKRVPARQEGKFVVDPVTGKKKRLYVDPKTGKKLYQETGEVYFKRRPKIIEEFDPATGKTKKVKVFYEEDPETGERIYYDKKGKYMPRQSKTTWMADTDDANTLSSGTRMETIYADHANHLKALANQARKSMIEVQYPPLNPSAKSVYADAVASLKDKLALAYKNKPLERQAQILANEAANARIRSNPDLDDDKKRKIRWYELDIARNRVGANKVSITITDREWDAIQAGAISKNVLNKILQNTDVDALRQRAMPSQNKGLSPARAMRAQALINAGHTRSDVADALGISLSTLNKVLE